MRLFDIENRAKLNMIIETVSALRRIRDSLNEYNNTVTGDVMFILERRYDISYVLQTLSKLEKISGYLVKTRLQNAGDVDRYDSFLTVMKKELPNLSNAFDTMKLDMSYIHTLQQRQDVFRT